MYHYSDDPRLVAILLALLRELVKLPDEQICGVVAWISDHRLVIPNWLDDEISEAFVEVANNFVKRQKNTSDPAI